MFLHITQCNIPRFTIAGDIILLVFQVVLDFLVRSPSSQAFRRSNNFI